MSGWFFRTVKVVVIIMTFIKIVSYAENLVVTSAAPDGEKINANLASDRLQDKKTSSYWSTEKDVTKDSIIPETVLRKNGDSAGSYCDIFYMLVSTVDGRVSALDLHRKGSLVWSVQADSRPLYSSSLASMEMIHNGKKMRLIPSLDGALYQFDGDKVEAVPLSAESLLSSTNRLSDDSMIVGSKDMRNFGINLHTGEIQFSCGSEGCSNSQGQSKDEPIEGNHFMILTRSTQVVRSVDMKNGNEKWNFSVGQHQIRLPPAARPSELDDNDDREYNVPLFATVSADECISKVKYADVTDYENLLQLLVPEGRIVALSKRDSSKVSWEHKFDSPIAKAWLLHHDKLDEMNLFDGHHIPSLNTYTPEDIEDESIPQPLLYIGSHQKLLYIQTSPQFETVLKTFTSHSIGRIIDPNIKVSWRPYLNTASVRTPIFGGNRPQTPHRLHSSNINIKRDSTSLTVWHEDYPFDTGYFLYPEFCDLRSPKRRNVMLTEDFPSRFEVNRNWLQVNLWLFWKEIVLINMMVLGVHVFVTRFFRPRQSAKMISDTSKNSESGDEVITSYSTSVLSDKVSNSEEYLSRFATDFDCLHCLGKGGFGVVFEAVNKVDDQHYAIKRIMLPKSEGAKEKVLREVKALARLEHTGIVRYFNAWVESPPIDWQEERDKQFKFLDPTGSTSYSNTASHLVQPIPEQYQLTPSSAMRGKINNNVNVQDTNPPRLRKEELDLDTDSIIFSSQTPANVHLLKQSGSEEFSVHSNLTETSSRNESDFIISHKSISQENLFSLEINTNSSSMNSTGDSFIGSKSSIPFSNYSFNSSALFSHFSDHSDQFSGDSVVFDSADNRLSSDNDVHHKSESYSNDSVVFEESPSVFEDKHTDENKQCMCQNDQGHQTEVLSPSSYKNQRADNREEMVEDKPEHTLCGTKFFVYIQMQLYRKETLKDWLSNNTLNRDRHTVLDIFDQIVCAVDYVHSQGLMHRDLKPSNIFFTADEIIKVGDFGLVTALNVQQDQDSEAGQKSQGRHTAEVGTTLYMSPEQIARKPYDFKIDIFSLGLIFLELLIPFSTQMERIRVLQDAKKQVFPLRFNRELPSESELVYKMTNSDPNLRPTTKDILDHSLFLEFAPTRIGTLHRKRTISNNSIN